MADPFSIAAGAVGIATAFTACLDVFEYVRLGREFGRDYQTCQLNLTILRLRLSRWGEAVGVYNDPQLGNPAASRKEIQAAKDTLIHVLTLFEDSARVSERFGIKADAEVLAPNESDGDGMLVILNRRARDIATRRQKGASLLKLARWSIHDNHAFRKLLDDISMLLGQLEILFPSPSSSEALAREEISQMGGQREVRALAAASEGLDDVLHRQASQATGHQYRDIQVEAGGDATVAQGNVFAAGWTGGAVVGASHSYVGITIKAAGGLRLVNGDRYGGVDPFER
ncbi:hypothetical protein NKR23_g5789 [Pleurostoma richardsiae]|uniref:Prion-inhibition and propagation HeLo domain-containing protein n=1 Tax=Pleurostoma richardsiae TaxID=41990 RepID=A0AA38VQ68_9PEZI|nr:hypothetical protein NKR23_g5789 [Pleurostoma richardsiae]